MHKLTVLQKRFFELWHEGRLKSAFMSRIMSRIRPYLKGALYCVWNPAGSKIKLHFPAIVEPAKEERPLVGRIFEAFRKMKEDQQRVATKYLPSQAWQNVLDNAYSEMISALRKNDLNTFHRLLANFGCSEKSLGFEGAATIKKYTRSFLGRRYLQNTLFFNNLRVWASYFGGRRDIKALQSPTIGNQAGAFLEGIFIDANAFWNDIYGSILEGILKSFKKKPVIADLGGVGKTDILYLALP